MADPRAPVALVGNGTPVALRSVERALEHRATAWLVAALFVAHGLWSIALDVHLHDEGLLTYIFAGWLADAPSATLFFQKAKPVTSLVYAPTTLLGYDGFFVAHVLVAASAIPMLDAIARRLELPLPAAPALLLATSPMYLGSAPAGLSNADGVVATILFLYVLICARRPLVAGIVLGCIPWVRYELSLLVVVFVAYAALRERRMLAGVLVFPVLYAVAGAIYHATPLWMVTFPPAMPTPMPGNPVYVHELGSFGLKKIALTLLAVSPAIVLAPWVRVGSLTVQERALAVFAILYFVAVNVLPLWQIFNFGFTPRYSLGLLPAVSLFAARAVGEWTRTPDRPRLRPAALLALAAAIAITPALDSAANVSRRSRDRGVESIASWVSEHRARIGEGPIVTDIAILDAFLERSGDSPALDVRFLVGLDQMYEIRGLANPDNGQRERLLAAMDEVFYGQPIAPGELTPENVPASAIFVLSRDDRVSMVLPEDAWRDRLRVVEEGERFTIAEQVGRP